MAQDPRTQELTDEQLEALLEVVFAVCLPDGELSRGELSQLRERLAQIEDGRLRPDRTEGVMLRAAMHLEKDGLAARLSHAREVLGDPDARRIALALAIEVAAADGLDDRERKAARVVADALSIAPNELDALLAA